MSFRFQIILLKVSPHPPSLCFFPFHPFEFAKILLICAVRYISNAVTYSLCFFLSAAQRGPFTLATSAPTFLINSLHGLGVWREGEREESFTEHLP